MVIALMLLAFALTLGLPGSTDTTDTDETLTGTDGDDTLQGSDGDELIEGLGGNDVLESWAGQDTLDGGEGNDTLTIGSPDGTVALGGDGDDWLQWIDGDATLSGGAGDDLVSLYGQDGTRTLTDGEIDGGDGFDALSLEGLYPSDLVIEISGAGNGMLSDGTANVSFTGIEAISLSEGRHLLDASGSTDGIAVYAETNLRAALSETLLGGSGDDILSEGNVMNGGAGDDLLIASQEGSVMTGGEGADSFVYTYEMYAPGNAEGNVSAAAVITDFDPGEDQLSLIVRYDEDYTDGGDPVHVDPPEVTTVEDSDLNQTVVMVNGVAAYVLDGVTGLDPEILDITLQPY